MKQLRERKILCFHLCVESKKAELTEMESRMVVTRGWQRGRGEMLVKGTNFQF